MVNVELPPWSYLLSAINIFAFAVPVFWITKRWLGWRNSIILFLILGFFALLIETNAIMTGFPYGHFGYSELLGFKLFGYVPWTVAFAWTPLIISAFAVARNLSNIAVLRIFIIAILLILFDLVIDPGAVLLGFWKYKDAGLYYGVPFLNFVGWGFSGILGAILLEVLVYYFKPLLPVPAQLVNSSFFIIFFWTAIVFFGGMIFPTLIGIGLIISLYFFHQKFSYRFDEMIVLVDENNNPIATIPKQEVHHDKTPLHRAFSVFLFNKKSELLLQQRNFDKKTWGGVWSNSCCGHLMLHESIKNAAKRRLKFELGISSVKLFVVLPDFRYIAEKDGVVENEICPVLVGFIEKEPNPNPEEVAQTKWIKWKDFLAKIDEPDNEFSPWSNKEAIQLSENKEFNDLYNKYTN